MGTPDYISPEQLNGNRGDARSDLYALGVMLYEMLTGQVPFQGPSPFAVMNTRLLHDPRPPREIEPAISPQLEAALLRVLERDPQRRYAAARDFAWALQHPEQIVADDHARQNRGSGHETGGGTVHRIREALERARVLIRAS